MDAPLMWRAALGQLIAVAALFGLLLALPLSEDFFREQGAVIGPVSWILCALVTGRVLSLDIGTTVSAAVAGGVAAALVALLAGHTLGLVAGIVAFGVAAAAASSRRLGGGTSAAGAS